MFSWFLLLLVKLNVFIRKHLSNFSIARMRYHGLPSSVRSDLSNNLLISIATPDLWKNTAARAGLNDLDSEAQSVEY